jgi:GGDEF domain-containing protein
MRLANMSATPSADDLAFVMSLAQKNPQNIVELPWATSQKQPYTLKVTCGLSLEEPHWMLHAGESEQLRVVWNYDTPDTRMLHNMIWQECEGTNLLPSDTVAAAGQEEAMGLPGSAPANGLESQFVSALDVIAAAAQPVPQQQGQSQFGSLFAFGQGGRGASPYATPPAPPPSSATIVQQPQSVSVEPPPASQQGQNSSGTHVPAYPQPAQIAPHGSAPQGSAPGGAPPFPQPTVPLTGVPPYMQPMPQALPQAPSYPQPAQPSAPQTAPYPPRLGMAPSSVPPYPQPVADAGSVPAYPSQSPQTSYPPGTLTPPQSPQTSYPPGTLTPPNQPSGAVSGFQMPPHITPVSSVESINRRQPPDDQQTEANTFPDYENSRSSQSSGTGPSLPEQAKPAEPAPLVPKISSVTVAEDDLDDELVDPPPKLSKGGFKLPEDKKESRIKGTLIDMPAISNLAGPSNIKGTLIDMPAVPNLAGPSSASGVPTPVFQKSTTGFQPSGKHTSTGDMPSLNAPTVEMKPGFQPTTSGAAPPINPADTIPPGQLGERLQRENAERAQKLATARDAQKPKRTLPPPVELDRAAVEAVWGGLTDASTGLLSKPAFLFFLVNEAQRHHRELHTFSVVRFEMRVRPPEGDKALPLPDAAVREAARRIFSRMRPLALIGQYDAGFAFLLPYSSREETTEFVADIYTILTTKPLAPDVPVQNLSLSFGCASIPEDCNHPGVLLAAAEHALTFSKANNRPMVNFEDAGPL